MALQQTLDLQMMMDTFVKDIYVAWNRDRVDTPRGTGRNRIEISKVTVDELDDYSWRDVIAEWAETDRFRWAMERALETPRIYTMQDIATYQRRFVLMAIVSDQSMTEWLLKYT